MLLLASLHVEIWVILGLIFQDSSVPDLGETEGPAKKMPKVDSKTILYLSTAPKLLGEGRE